MKTPVYIFDTDAFDHNVAMLRAAFGRNGGTPILSYSVKTNPHKDVITAAKRNGMLAEIVSTHEYDLVKELGYEDNSIIFNGVIPDDETKANVAFNGGIVNVENIDELRRIGDIARAAKRQISLGIRVDVSTELCKRARFGIDHTSHEMDEAIEYVEGNPYVSINCIHSHYGWSRTLETWKKRATECAKVAKTFGAAYLDLGSHLYGSMDYRRKAQINDYIPSFDEYADLVYACVNEVYGDLDKPTIVLETGTPIVADTVSLAAEVLHIRNSGERCTAVVNCSKFDMGFAACKPTVPFDVIRNNEPKSFERIDICGCTCVEDDYLHKDWSGDLAVGDIIVFRNVGGYSVSLSNDFITPKIELVSIPGGADK